MMASLVLQMLQFHLSHTHTHTNASDFSFQKWKKFACEEQLGIESFKLHTLDVECKNRSRQVTWTTEFCMEVPNICEFSLWNLLHVTLLVPRILRWLLDFWNICVPLL